MLGDGLLLLEFSRCNAPARAGEWADWYDNIELPAAVERGADVVTRFEVSPAPVPGMPSIGFSHVAIHEFRGDDAVARAEAAQAVRAEQTYFADAHANHCLINLDLLAAHGNGGSKSEPAEDLEGHVLAYVMPNRVARYAEWDAWYDEMHLPDMMQSGAFRAGSRWRRNEPSAFGAADVTLYDVAGMSLREAVERSAAVMPGIAERGRKLDCHVGAMSFRLQACGRWAGKGCRR
ncbi:MAG: hypothetical protein AB8G23_02560 [Myxococcota bacterium]